MSLRIIEADPCHPLDAAGMLEVLDSYAADPVGGGRPLSQDVRDRLPSMLRAHSGALVLLALLDERHVGVAVCFFGIRFLAKELEA